MNSQNLDPMVYVSIVYGRVVCALVILCSFAHNGVAMPAIVRSTSALDAKTFTASNYTGEDASFIYFI